VRLACVLSLAAAWPQPGWAQDSSFAPRQASPSVQKQTLAAFSTGNVQGLLAHAGDQVALGILSAGALYSRNQAVYVMEEFFRQYPPGRVVLQESSEREGNWFAAGQYWYRGGEHPLRIYVRFRQRGAQWELKEIRIEQG
jgi:hypothetical protein